MLETSRRHIQDIMEKTITIELSEFDYEIIKKAKEQMPDVSKSLLADLGDIVLSNIKL